MKKRLSVIALVGGLALMLAGGAALADPVRSSSNWWDDMHDSAIMQQMRDQMPPALQGKCDRMHEQMSQWYEQHPDATTGPGGMMGGSTSGSGMMSF